ncbi:MAG: GNAT family N-acetyltransferase [Rhodobacteraceae bacterium]|nr:GNAT family N-acetyltransferase [Paracoccaceae bacterium]
MSEDVTCHLAGPHNAELLIGCDVFDNDVDPAQLAAFLADPGHMLVFAAIGARIVGFASGNTMLHPDKPPAFFINEVGVAEDFQRRGIATTLCEMLLKAARDGGCKGIWLATETDNHAARALYQRLRARETRDIVVYDWDGAMDDPSPGPGTPVEG